jgi:ribose transport system permease protein
MFAKISNSIKVNRSSEYFRFVIGQKELRLFVLLAAMVAIMAVLRPDTFFTSTNLFNILRQISLITIVAVAQTLVIISGGIDLSVGFNLGLCGIIISYLLGCGF